jgi:TolA-binding protein
MKRCGIFLALLLAGVLMVTFSIGCTAPKRPMREEVTPRGDVEKLEARFDQFEKNYAAATRDIRTGQANLGADLGAVRDELRTLRGQVEGVGKSQNLKKQLDDLASRVGDIENSMKKGKGETDGQRSEATDAVPAAEVKTDPKAAYNDCYKLFKEGQNEKARQEFQKFLKQGASRPVEAGHVVSETR